MGCRGTAVGQLVPAAAHRGLQLTKQVAQPLADALEGIEAMEAFFKSIGMPTRISDMDIHLTDEQIKELAYKCSFNNTRTIGGFKALNIDDMEKIYQMAK